MPITSNGKEVMQSMVKQYGQEKAKHVFYASINAHKRGTENWHGKPVLGKQHKKGEKK